MAALAVCLKCQSALSPGLSPGLESPSDFEIDFARALITGRTRGREETRSALEELVRRFDVVAQRLLNARATNMELETSLKIARSNLVLAEANTEALEETLRRRAPQLQPAAFPGGAPSSGLLGRIATPDVNLWGDPLVTSPIEGALGEDQPKNGISAFFRRKRTNPSTPLIISPAPDSVSSVGDFPPLPPSPLEAETPSDAATNGLLPTQAAALIEERTLLARRLEQLTALLTNERVATKELRNSHADLVVERDKLNVAHNEMQGELENLSAALFEEANNMVAAERRRVAEYEQEIEDLRNEVEALRRGEQVVVARRPDSYDDPTTARPYVSESSPSVATDASPAVSQVTSDGFSQQESSPAMTRSDVSSSAPPFSARSSPAVASSPAFVPSPVLSAPRIAAAGEAPGRSWLKSFNSRRQNASRQDIVEDAMAAISTDSPSIAKPPTPHSGDSVRRSLTLEDNDLLPHSVTPSPGVSPIPPQAELPTASVNSREDVEAQESRVRGPVPLRESTIKAVMQQQADTDEEEVADRRSRTTSYESWNKRSTSSSFASPNIETAFLNSPPVPALPRARPANGKRVSSPRRSSSLSRRGRPSSPPAMPSRSPALSDASSSRSPDPSYSEPIPQQAMFSRSDGSLPTRKSSNRSAHLSQSSTGSRDKRSRPAPLQLVTPPMSSTEQMPNIERAPTPKSARRAGLVLGLDAAQLFPHRGPEARGLAVKHGADEREVRGYAGASKGFAQALSYAAPNGRGVGLMRQVPRPDTPLSPMARDLDKLLDELSQINDELAFAGSK